MNGPIALVHGAEGAGNGTRMLAVAAELRRRGAALEIAGGGRAARFVEMNGFDEFKPAHLEFIERTQGPEATLLQALWHSAPRALRRTRGLRGWLSEIDPAVLLTDDPMAAIPAMLQGIPWFRIDHSSVGCYSGTFARTAFRAWNGFTLRYSEGFFFTTVFENPYPEKTNLRPVGPVAHEPEDLDPVDPFDVLLAPSTYANGFDDLKRHLEAAGFSVKHVGSADWEPVSAMLPYHEAADVVVTGGFSATSEALIAGTPVLNYPFIDCQRGLAEQIEARGIRGIEIVRSNEEAIEGVGDPPQAPAFENGAPEIAEHILEYTG